MENKLGKVRIDPKYIACYFSPRKYFLTQGFMLLCQYIWILSEGNYANIFCGITLRNFCFRCELVDTESDQNLNIPNFYMGKE